MKMPKTVAGIRYLSSTDYNTRITFQQPNAGQTADGTANLPTVVKCVWANVSPWRSKEEDKTQIRVAVSSFKIVIPYPFSFSLDSGMQIMVGSQLHNIDSFYDPDGQRHELHIYTFVTDSSITAVS
jgi:SPP1 family predicted phage head-tail adaptor